MLNDDLFSQYEENAKLDAQNEVNELLTRMENIDYDRNDYDEAMIGEMNKYQVKHLNTFIDTYQYDRDEVIASIANDPICATAILGKTPSRTGWQENAQYDTIAQYCANKSFFVECENLPKSGSGALYLTEEGTIDSWGPTKSIDFLLTTQDNYQIAIAAKYTRIKGGAQDNQRRDLTEFASYAPNKDTNTKVVVVLLADGPYYELHHSDYGKHNNFYDFIRGTYGKQKVIVTDTFNFDYEIDKFFREEYERCADNFTEYDPEWDDLNN